MQRGPVLFFVISAVFFAVICVISVGCNEQRAAPHGHGRSVVTAKPTGARSARANTVGVTSKKAPPAALPVAASPTESSAALRATRARIDILTAPAETMVRRIEATPPDRTMSLRLDAAFIDTRRLMTTDLELADLGKQLSEADQAAVQRTTKARYEALKRRVAAAGIRHRRAAAEQRAAKNRATPGAGSAKDDGAVAGH